ncbi:MAG: carbohydrate ABC transporter permease [Clostridia bacterium]|nr:carbohydrate ABC transporter permease [Clostridia bacterium]
MNAEMNKPRVKRESRNRIRVDFDRSPLKERLKAKFLNWYFLQKILLTIFRLVLLIGISYVVLYPFITKISASFMSVSDFVDTTVRLIPKHFSLEIYRGVLTELNYAGSLMNTFFLSTAAGVIQTFICALIGYGLAKFKFKGNKVVFILVILTMVIPHGTLHFAMFMKFRFFDIYGVFNLLSKAGIMKAVGGINLINTFWPLMLMSLTGLAFKNGLYIFLMRQFFRGLPDELEESAYLDGSNTLRTFVSIILPLSIPMLVTVFLFAFCWQWTDTFYSGIFFNSTKVKLLTNFIDTPKSLARAYKASPGWDMYNSSIINTCGLVIIFPLVILYVFLQNFLVQGIERSGLTAS